MDGDNQQAFREQVAKDLAEVKAKLLAADNLADLKAATVRLVELIEELTK